VRGDLLCRPHNRPHMGSDLDTMVCWMAEDVELKPDGRYTLQHTTRTVAATVRALDYRLNVNTLHRDEEATSLTLNEIGRIRLRTQQPLLFDPYRRNRDTGSFVLVDDVTNNTVAAGMITGPAVTVPNVVSHKPTCTREQRATVGMTVWLTGLSASGKSTVGAELERRLVVAGRPAYLLDGDNLRHGVNAGLGFTMHDRQENVRRAGEIAKLFADAGLIAVVSLISPYRADRDQVRQIHENAGLRFVEVFVDTPLEVCAERDPKGLYAKARAGEITGFTGVDDPYEVPHSPDVILRPDDGDPGSQAGILLDWLGG
jgi:bifunctional enzyme CysN/CysC